MKKKSVIVFSIALVGAFIIGAIVWMSMTGYSRVLKTNWELEIPFSARCSEVYEKDTGASFNGDGIRFHVFSCKNEDRIDDMLVWTDDDHSTIYYGSLSEAAEQWLDVLDVPEEWRPEYDDSRYYYCSQEDNSELIIFWSKEAKMLYIVENFV